MANFFTDWNAETWSPEIRRAGRKPRQFEHYIRTKAWFSALAERIGAENTNQVIALLPTLDPDLFPSTDSGLWYRYAKGTVSPKNVYLDRVEQRFPGSASIYQDGPHRLWHAMFGEPGDCWDLAQVLRTDGEHYIGYDVPIESSVGRLCEMVACKLEKGIEHDLTDFVRLVAMFRLHLEISKLTLLESEGPYELLWLLLAQGAIAQDLDRYKVSDDVFHWLATKQGERIALDKRWRVAFHDAPYDGGDDQYARYLCFPFDFVLNGPEEIANRHGYLIAMPSVVAALRLVTAKDQSHFPLDRTS